MSDLLSIGRTGIFAYRTALATVSENVVNAETEGYARRTVRLTESNVSSGSNYRYRASAVFGGVDIADISRAWDEYKAADARVSSSEASRAETRLRWLDNVETMLDDSDVGTGVKLTAVFTSADALATDPSSTVARNAFLLALDEAAGGIRNTAVGLSRVADGITEQARNTVSLANGALTALADVNNGLKRAVPGTAAHAQLLDERDRLIGQVANAVGVDASYDTFGRVTLTVAGTSGATLVEGSIAAFLGVVPAIDGRLSLVASGNGATTGVFPLGGSLAALVDVASTVADRRTQLDDIARGFAEDINDWQAQGRTEANVAGVPLLDASGGAMALALLTRDPAAVAAASADGTANGNALALSELRGVDGVEQRWAMLVNGQAQVVQAARAEASAATARRDGALAALDGITGIDLDVEAAELLRYQQAYGGAAKILQVARETLQTVLDLF